MGDWVGGRFTRGGSLGGLCPYMFSFMHLIAICSNGSRPSLTSPALHLFTEASVASRSEKVQRGAAANLPLLCRPDFRLNFPAVWECIDFSFLLSCLISTKQRPLPLRKGQRWRLRARLALGWCFTNPQPSVSRRCPVLQTRTAARASVSTDSSYP
jgi:hypothetical protein